MVFLEILIKSAFTLLIAGFIFNYYVEFYRFIKKPTRRVSVGEVILWVIIGILLFLMFAYVIYRQYYREAL